MPASGSGTKRTGPDALMTSVVRGRPEEVGRGPNPRDCPQGDIRQNTGLACLGVLSKAGKWPVRSLDGRNEAARFHFAIRGLGLRAGAAGSRPGERPNISAR